jgi:hypothetical protein
MIYLLTVVKILVTTVYRAGTTIALLVTGKEVIVYTTKHPDNIYTTLPVSCRITLRQRLLFFTASATSRYSCSGIVIDFS